MFKGNILKVNAFYENKSPYKVYIVQSENDKQQYPFTWDNHQKTPSSPLFWSTCWIRGALLIQVGNISSVTISLSISLLHFHLSRPFCTAVQSNTFDHFLLLYIYFFHLAFNPIPSFSVFYLSLAPYSVLFYQSLLSPLTHLSTSLRVDALQSHQSRLCPSQQHRSRNESVLLRSPVTRSSFIIQLRGGKAEWSGDFPVEVQDSMLRPPYGHFINL